MLLPCAFPVGYGLSLALDKPYMTLELYAAFVAATIVLMLIPGPNVALITANSIRHGPRWGLVTVAGTCAAMIPQLALTALGMTEALGLAGRWFVVLRWVGVAYLLWLGVQAWGGASHEAVSATDGRAPLGAVFLNGFLVSATNPKTLLFYAAFFPQFVAADHRAGQLWLLAATFLVLAAVIDCGWALLAGRLRGVLASHSRLRGRMTGAVLIAAGAGLAVARGGR
jgi:threonine/homoserine/homoserine lactone efflux protein